MFPFLFLLYFPLHYFFFLSKFYIQTKLKCLLKPKFDNNKIFPFTFRKLPPLQDIIDGKLYKTTIAKKKKKKLELLKSKKSLVLKRHVSCC